MLGFDAAVKGIGERTHAISDEQCIIDAGRQDRLGQRDMEGIRLIAQFAHRPEHRDPAGRTLLLAEQGERRRHRGRIGVIALVDHQHLAAVNSDPAARTAAGQLLQLAERQTGGEPVTTKRIDHRQHRQRIRHPVRAGRCDGEAERGAAQAGGDKAAALFRPALVARADIGAFAAAKGDDPRGMGTGGGDQPVAMRRIIGDHRGAAGLQPLEDLALGVGDRFLAGEEGAVRRRDRRHQRDMRAHKPGQLGQLAGVIHPHLEHAEASVARHPRERQRHAGVIVVAFDRAMRPARRDAVERGEDRLFGAGLADRAGDADDARLTACACPARHRIERRGDIADQHMRMIDWLRHHRAGSAASERGIDEAMAVGRLARHRDEQLAAPDLA